MKNRKKIELVDNDVGGYDLIVERDAGNPVRILTGRTKFSLEFWEELKLACEEAVEEIEYNIKYGLVDGK